MSQLHHVNNGLCPLCQEKLLQAAPKLAEFATKLQANVHDIHVSWTYRGQADQDAAFRRGTSQAQFGQSKHNVLPSLAVDFFRLALTGASWDAGYFTRVLAPEARKAGLVWGGDWAKFKDFSHVEIA